MNLRIMPYPWVLLPVPMPANGNVPRAHSARGLFYQRAWVRAIKPEGRTRFWFNSIQFNLLYFTSYNQEYIRSCNKKCTFSYKPGADECSIMPFHCELYLYLHEKLNQDVLLTFCGLFELIVICGQLPLDVPVQLHAHCGIH